MATVGVKGLTYTNTLSHYLKTCLFSWRSRRSAKCPQCCM